MKIPQKHLTSERAFLLSVKGVLGSSFEFIIGILIFGWALVFASPLWQAFFHKGFHTFLSIGTMAHLC